MGHHDRPRSWATGLSRRELFHTVAGSAAALGLGTSLVACGDSPETGRGSGSKPKRGGTVRVGVAGGGPRDSFDAHVVPGRADNIRVALMYETLTKYDEKFELKMHLAEELKPEAADRWVIRLRPGLTFHSGKPVTADDVIYSLRRIADPKNKTIGGGNLWSFDPRGVKKLDERTVRVHLEHPDMAFPENLGLYYMGIVPEDYDPRKPIGTGAFKFESITPGERSTVVRYDDYWKSGRPYLDGVTILALNDDNARINALLGGQVEAINEVTYGQVAAIRKRDDLVVLEQSRSGTWPHIAMRADVPPFDDRDVRQAMRLIVDRPKMVKQAISGHGEVANDVFAPFDPCFLDSLPQREQDLDRARFLLKRAGREGLAVTLHTSAVAQGTVESGQVFAEQAKGAGVDVTVKQIDPAEYYGEGYLERRFAQDSWGVRNYLTQVGTTNIPSAYYNLTHWPDDSNEKRYLGLYNQALRTVDDEKRCEVIQEMQRIDWNQGAYIIWGFANNVDAYSTKITGFRDDRSTLPLNSYGFDHVWFA